ncbi:MAG: hypothetical protein J6S63_06865 [Atopobiaceae bacterium]|nr:hypothetical protein [Atopobiaceae bacterium]
MRTIEVTVTYIDELLGTASADPEIHARFIASKAPDAPSRADEVAAIGAEAVEERAMTVFPRTEDGQPFTWDYQWKGFFKDSCGMLRRADGTKSKGLKAYKKEIDGLLFVSPRRIPLVLPDGAEVGSCQRPLRASTPQGERVALANSETVPAGTTQTFQVHMLRDDLEPLVMEWLAYGRLHGKGQWRNSGKGRFTHVAHRVG